MSEITLPQAWPRPLPRLVRTLARALARVWLWHERTRQRAQLARLDDSLLRDIGVSRDAAEAECAKPFWR
jgi:uncharacterized protein YjiS (DUF1127 family)